MRALGLATVPLVMAGGLLGLVLLMGASPPAESSALCLPVTTDTQATAEFDAEQLANAAMIVGVGRARGVPPRGWVIAVAAAMQESSLRNVRYGDRDSAGLFQMRPSMGWGTLDQVTDPAYAANAFYGGPDVPPANPGLLDVDGWQQMTVSQAAQAVERSAYPDAYDRWVAAATALVTELGGAELECSAPVFTTCAPSGLTVESGLMPDAVAVVRCAVEQFGITAIGGLATSGHVSGSDHYTGRGVDLMINGWQSAAGAQFGDEVAAYYVENADAFGITYVIWRGQIWSASRPGWRPYRHPDGRADMTALHMDHLHISVAGNASTSREKESTP
jgi:hypothetical protein